MNKKLKYKWVIVWKYLYYFNCFVVSIFFVEDMYCIIWFIYYWRDEFWWKFSVGKFSYYFLFNVIYYVVFLWFY